MCCTYRLHAGNVQHPGQDSVPTPGYGLSSLIISMLILIARRAKIRFCSDMFAPGFVVILFIPTLDELSCLWNIKQ